MAYARTGDQPEAMINVLFRLLERTPEGGATMQELKNAYREVKESEPSDRTIYRMIRRINELFDPLAYDTDDEDDPESRGTVPEGAASRLIECRPHPRDPRGRCYVVTRDLSTAPRLGPADAFMMTLGVYPQRKNLLAGPFEAVMKCVLQYSLSKVAEWQNMQREIEQYVYLSDHTPAKPEKNAQYVYKVFEAIRRRKRLKMDYMRIRDGELIRGRQIEPYGVVNRHGSWYFVGKTIGETAIRIYRFDHVRSLSMLESSEYSIPADFSLKKHYGPCWGTWTEDSPAVPENVRICGAGRLAERFDQVRFHESQRIEARPDGTICVSFCVAGAQEMVPWILSWGDAIRVEEPLWLAQAVRDAAERIWRSY